MVRRLVVIILLSAACAGLSTAAHGASSSTIVTANLLSGTSLDASGCAQGTANITEMGAMLPNQTSVTSADCLVNFGSSNDTSQLRIAQSDSFGTSMWMATAGQLDQTFDGPSGSANGQFLSPISAASDIGNAVTVQSDRKIIAAGSCYSGTSNDFCLARYNTDGSLDTAFDGPGAPGNGTFLDPIGSGYDSIHGVSVQTDGRIVAAGYCAGGTNDDFCLARYNTDGSLDTGFDGPGAPGNGEFIHAIGTGDDQIKALTVRSDGSILAAGWCDGATNNDFCLARYNADGSLDSTFDGPGAPGNGMFIDAIGTGNDFINAAAVQPDGKIVVGGYCWSGANDDFCLARYNTDGSRDVTFDGPGAPGNGKFLDGVGTGNDYLNSLALQSDGKIVASGYCHNGSNYDFCLARYNTDGSLDTAFDGPGAPGNGEFLSAIGTGHDYGQASIMQVDGKVIASGRCSNGANMDFCLARFASDGSLDAAFDGPGTPGNGKFLDPVGSAADQSEAAIAVEDGRIVVVGYCNNGANHDFCLARFDQGGQVADYANTTTDWNQGASMFGACLRAVAGGASAQWTPDASCPATDGAYWNPIPATATKVAYTTAFGTLGATANLRFGVRSAVNQPPGTYTAPITFDVLAPNT